MIRGKMRWLEFETYVESASDGVATLAEARDVPHFVRIALLRGNLESVAHAPAQVERSPNLSIDAKEELGPLIAAPLILDANRLIATPYRVFRIGIPLEVKLGEGKASAHENTIYVLLVLGQIVVETYAEIRGVGLDVYSGDGVSLVVAGTITHFESREELILEIDLDGTLILPVVAHHAHDGTNGIIRHLYTLEEAHAVFWFCYNLLVLSQSRGGHEQETTQESVYEV